MKLRVEGTPDELLSKAQALVIALIDELPYVPELADVRASLSPEAAGADAALEELAQELGVAFSEDEIADMLLEVIALAGK